MTVWCNFSSPTNTYMKKLWSARKIPGNFHENNILESDLHGWPVHTERTLIPELLVLESLCPALAAEAKGSVQSSAVLPPRGSVCPSHVATEADIAVVHRALNRANTSMWCLIKSFLGKYEWNNPEKWICRWDHKCLYLHFQVIVLSWDHCMLGVLSSFTYIFKRKRWKHNGNRGLDF